MGVRDIVPKIYRYITSTYGVSTEHVTKIIGEEKKKIPTLNVHHLRPLRITLFILFVKDVAILWLDYVVNDVSEPLVYL